MSFDITKTKLQSGCFLQATSSGEISLKKKPFGWLRIFYVQPGTRLEEVAKKVADQIKKIKYSDLNYREFQILNYNLTFLEKKMTKHRSGYFFKFFQELRSCKFFPRFHLNQEIDSNHITGIKDFVRELLSQKKWVDQIPRLIGLLNDITQMQNKNFKTLNRSLAPQLSENYLSNMPITCCEKIFDYIVSPSNHIVNPSNKVVEEALQRLAKAYLEFFESLQAGIAPEEASNQNRDNDPSNHCFINSAFAIKLVEAKLKDSQIWEEKWEEKKNDLQRSLMNGFTRFINKAVVGNESVDSKAQPNLSSENKRPIPLNKMMQSPLPNLNSLIKSFLDPTALGRSVSLNQAHWKSSTPEEMIASLGRSDKVADSGRFIDLLNELKTRDLTVFPPNSIERKLIEQRNSYLLEKYMEIFLKHLKPEKQNEFFNTLNNDLFSCAFRKLPKTTVALDLSFCEPITDEGLAHLGKLPALTSLNLSWCHQITDERLENLGKLRALTSLNLYCCDQITDKGLAHLGKLRALTSLNLKFCCNITDEGLAHLGKLRALTSLDLYRCNKITDAGLQHLSNLSALTSLDLSWCRQITDAGLAHLSELHTLTSLNLSDCTRITDGGLEHLGKLDALTSLELSMCEQITGRGLKHLSNLSALTFLNLVGCIRIRNAALRRIRNTFPILNIIR